MYTELVIKKSTLKIAVGSRLASTVIKKYNQLNEYDFVILVTIKYFGITKETYIKLKFKTNTYVFLNFMTLNNENVPKKGICIT